jgi:hypothetical protein
MKLASLLLAASALALSACATTPSDGPSVAGSNLQEAASLMVSIGQHGEGSDSAGIAELSAQLDQQVAAAPNDPFVLKLAAQSRRVLAEYSPDRAQRTKLRDTAIAEFDKAISFSKPDTASRLVTINGQETEIDLKDIPDLRAQTTAAIQADT